MQPGEATVGEATVACKVGTLQATVASPMLLKREGLGVFSVAGTSKIICRYFLDSIE